jgi:hypothetical protein
MTTRVDTEEIEITRGERTLAFVLTVFLLVGGLWAYYELNRTDDDQGLRDPRAQLSAPDRAALARAERAERRAGGARGRVFPRRRALADRREAYRTALDAGRRDAELERRYRAAQTRYDDAVAFARARNAQARRAQDAARPARARLARAEEAEEQRRQDRERRDAWITAGTRLALVLGLLGASLWLAAALRRRRSRWLTAAYASVVAAGLLGLVMGVDYLTDWFDPVDLGPLVLSVLGAAITLVALGALQRRLARRLPGKRVRRGECPFCGYPTGRGEHCEGCGREVLATCARCSSPRRVGTPHCATCGET